MWPSDTSAVDFESLLPLQIKSWILQKKKKLDSNIEK